MAERQKLDWHPIDVKTFPKAIGTLWDQYKNAYDTHLDAMTKNVAPKKEALEKAVTGILRDANLVGENQEVRFAYQFGGFAFAVQDASDKPKNKVDLSTITAQAGEGRVGANSTLHRSRR